MKIFFLVIAVWLGLTTWTEATVRSTSCTHPVNGVIISLHEGQQFKNDCNMCVCNNGIVLCTKKRCKKKTTRELEANICIVTVNGEKTVYHDGEQFQKDCNKCFCNNGRVRCTLKACIKKTRREVKEFEAKKKCFVIVDGKKTVYHDGQQFQKDCNKCFCDNGRERCTMKACINLESKKDCILIVNGEKTVYHDGEGFKKYCNTCFCSNGAHVCTKLYCLHG